MSFIISKYITLKSIDFISFETDKFFNMKEMFEECNGLEYLNLSN